jgi:hypothetical protein
MYQKMSNKLICPDNGSGLSYLFHPGKRIHEKYLPNARGRVTGAVITGEEMRRVSQKVQMSYLISIPGFDEALELYIVKKTFQVDVNPKTVFESEVRMVMPAAPPPPVNEERASLKNVAPNVFSGSKEIQQLQAEGIEVDNDNKPLPKDAEPPPPKPKGMQYNYQTPTLLLLG